MFPPRRYTPPLGPPRRTQRDRVLTAWRGIDVIEQERILGKAAKQVAAFLPAITQKWRLDKRQMDAEIIKVWNHLIAPDVAAHAQPVGLAKGTLFVKVDSSVWLSEIVRYRRREILDRLQHSFGKQMIVKISFQI